MTSNVTFFSLFCSRPPRVMVPHMTNQMVYQDASFFHFNARTSFCWLGFCSFYADIRLTFTLTFSHTSIIFAFSRHSSYLTSFSCAFFSNLPGSPFSANYEFAIFHPFHHLRPSPSSHCVECTRKIRFNSSNNRKTEPSSGLQILRDYGFLIPNKGIVFIFFNKYN